MSRYRITLIRTEFNQWEVCGYWEHQPDFEHGKAWWSLDGVPLYFKTRKEALEHCLNTTGIPE